MTQCICHAGDGHIRSKWENFKKHGVSLFSNKKTTEMGRPCLSNREGQPPPSPYRLWAPWRAKYKHLKNRTSFVITFCRFKSLCSHLTVWEIVSVSSKKFFYIVQITEFRFSKCVCHMIKTHSQKETVCTKKKERLAICHLKKR